MPHVILRMISPHIVRSLPRMSAVNMGHGEGILAVY